MKKSTMLFFLLSFTAGAFAQEFEIEGIRYRVTDNVQFKVEVIPKTSLYEGSVTIPASVAYDTREYSVTGIKEGAFADCTDLTSLTIPNSVLTIGDEAFFNCSSLLSIAIPGSVTAIGSAPFAHCKALTSIEVDMTNPQYVSINGVLYTKGGKTLRQYPGGKRGHFVVPDGVTTIDDGAFYGCTNLTSVHLANSVTTIEEKAFSDCIALSSIHLSNSVQTIGSGAFAYCANLESLTIPNSVATIGGGAFYNCSGLIYATIGSGLTTIESSVFVGCNALTSITVDEANGQFSSMDGVLYNKDKTVLMLHPSGKAGSFITPNSVTTIGDEAFQHSIHLNSVSISNSVTTIGLYAFAYCQNLTSVTISSNVSTIGSYAFFRCSGLTAITCLNSTPPELKTEVFSGVNLTPCTLYVPENSVTLYAAAEQWREFSNITPISASSVSVTTVGAANLYTQAGTLYVKGATRPYMVYSLTGAQIYTGTAPSITLPHGVYVVSISGERHKIMIQ